MIGGFQHLYLFPIDIVIVVSTKQEFNSIKAVKSMDNMRSISNQMGELIAKY